MTDKASDKNKPENSEKLFIVLTPGKERAQTMLIELSAPYVKLVSLSSLFRRETLNGQRLERF